MPATAVTVNPITTTGLTKPSAVACDNVNGNSAVNGGTTWLELTSSAGGTVTFPYAVTVDGQAVASRVVSFTGAQTKLVGPFPTAYYGTALTFTASVSTITYIAYQL
jgi:hypothetical protein